MGRAGRRGAGMAAATAVGALGLWWLAEAAVAGARAVGAASPAAPDEVLTLVAAVAALAVGTWLLVGFTLSVLAHLPGAAGDLARRWAEQISPAVVRRVAAVVVGASLSGALAPGTATADGPAGGHRQAGRQARTRRPWGRRWLQRPPPRWLRRAARRPAPRLLGSRHRYGRRPLRPRGGRPTALSCDGRPPPGWWPPTRRPTSARGWSCAGATPCGTSSQRHLGPDASDAEVAAEWPRWHEANRDVIGHDPDLLLPGQVLQAPAAAGGAAMTAPTTLQPIRVLPIPQARPARDHPAGAQCAGPGERDRRRERSPLHPGRPRGRLRVGERRAALRPPAHRPQRPARPGRTGRGTSPRPSWRSWRGCASRRRSCGGPRPRSTPSWPGAARCPPAAGTPATRRAVVRSVRVCEPADGVAEACAVVLDGGRVRALAMRLVGMDGRWRIEALQVG